MESWESNKNIVGLVRVQGVIMGLDQGSQHKIRKRFIELRGKSV